MHPRQLVRDSVVYAASQYVLRALLMLRGLFAARLLGPALYGSWNAIQLVMDYGQLAPLGTMQGLDQTVPPRLVDGDPDAIARLKRSGLFNVTVLTLGYAVGITLYFSVFATSSGKILGFWGLRGIGIALLCVLLSNLGQYSVNLLRAHGNIPAIAGWYLTIGILGAGLALALLPFIGVWGLLIAWLVGLVVASALTAWRCRHIMPFVPRAAGESLALLRIGVPMYIYSGSTFIMRTLDRVIILKFLGTLELGYYSLAVTGVTMLLYLPESVSFVLYPQLLRAYHESGGRPAAIRDRVERAYRAIGLLVPAMCGLFYIAVRDLMALLLPRFLPGLSAVRIVAFGVGGLAFVGLSAITLMTLRRQRHLISASIASVILGASLDLFAVTQGGHIVAVAWATLAAYVLNGVLMFSLAITGLRESARVVPGALARVFTPLAIAAGLAWSVDLIVPGRDGLTLLPCLTHMIVGCALFLGVYLVLSRPFSSGLGMRQTLSEFNIPFLRRNGGGGR